MMARWLVFSVMVSCFLLPGCITIPSGNQAGHVIVSKAKDGAAHVGARLLQKKIGKLEIPDTVSEKSLPPDPAERISLQARDIETMSIKSRVKDMVRVLLHKASFAAGWGRVQQRTQYPSDILSEVDSCFFTGRVSDEPFIEIGSKQQGKPFARVSHKRLFLGFRWKFIAMLPVQAFIAAW